MEALKRILHIEDDESIRMITSVTLEAVGNLEAAMDNLPTGLTIVSVDYDSSDDVKRQYGVTTQHTFVQIDADGNELAKWTGSTTAEQIAQKTT